MLVTSKFAQVANSIEVGVIRYEFDFNLGFSFYFFGDLSEMCKLVILCVFTATTHDW